MKWIDEILIGLLDTYGTNDPYELCDILSIDIKKMDNGGFILKGEDSVYIRDYNDRETIFIRNDLHSNYEKFYLRHELGHAILHPDILCSYQNELINFDKMEKQANYFAFKLCDLQFDQVEMYQMTLKQIASYIRVPEKVLYQIVMEDGIKYGH